MDSGEYILQKINTGVFTDPEKLMDNIVNVTEFLRKKITAQGGNPDRKTLTVVKTVDGSNLYRAENGEVFRVYKYIPDSVSVNGCPGLDRIYSAAKSFGNFQSMLKDYPADSLFEIIPDFHDTPKRFEALMRAIA